MRFDICHFEVHTIVGTQGPRLCVGGVGWASVGAWKLLSSTLQPLVHSLLLIDSAFNFVSFESHTQKFRFLSPQC